MKVFTVVVLVALAGGMTQAPVDAELDAAFEAFWSAPTAQRAAQAGERIAALEAPFAETWARLERANYTTVTDAGYEVLVRTAEAMEQMNTFYREFFRYGSEDDSRSVPRIQVRIFKNRDEYLTLGQSPAEWSGGQFTGDAVETYIDSGFEAMVGTLFHEAAHQFVSLATNAVGWLNEGLASFFEGCVILASLQVICF